MKASSATSTRVRVVIPIAELVGFVRKGGIHVPDGVDVCTFSAPFDEEDSDGIVVEWTVDHDAPKQG